MRKEFDFYSRSNQLVLDGCCFAISFAAAYPIRLEAWPAGANLRQLIIWLPILITARLFVHWTRGIYRQVWQFVSFSDAIEIAKSILIVTGVLALLRFGFPGKSSFSALVKIPASVIAVEGLFSLTLSIGIRALRRIQHLHQRRAAAAGNRKVPLKRALLYGAGRAGVPAKIIPGLQELLAGQVELSQLREPRVEEVLGRERVEVTGFEEIAGMAYAGKRVLVTGGGGSIGSELVRQLARLKPSRIAFLDKDENSIYELEQELCSLKPAGQVEPIVADVRNPNRLRAIFSDFRPQVVFHAAAHKHVPLMEMHPCEAVLNNVGGTQTVLDLCAELGDSRFVFISSDKAVNPASVMGATKRLGELMVQSAARRKGLSAACVRFGNVLGSRGSVVPLFNRQIALGGPVTVTHPEMVRFFMTVQEAVQLILCAGTLAQSGEIFVLDMGSPRKILDLAREMIWHSGFEPEKDIETRIAGLRPGEKLCEELIAANETLLPTRFGKISMVASPANDESFLARDIARLLRIARNNDRPQVFGFLSDMNLGFRTAVPVSKPESMPSAIVERSTGWQPRGTAVVL
jgi:FlaA1/EpsC-like NDP-sugar epimerase